MTLEVKDYYEIEDFYMDGKPLVQRARVYNLGNAVRGGKFPMALDTKELTTQEKRYLSLPMERLWRGMECCRNRILLL